MKTKKRIGKKEMNLLFKKHNLDLSFPVGAKNGSEVTDWDYWYHRKTYEESDLLKFKEIIKTKYKNTYELYNVFCGATIGIKRI